MIMTFILIFHLLWRHTKLLNLKILGFMLAEKKPLTLHTLYGFLTLTLHSLLLDLLKFITLLFNESLVHLSPMILHGAHLSANVMALNHIQLT